MLDFRSCFTRQLEFFDVKLVDKGVNRLLVLLVSYCFVPLAERLIRLTTSAEIPLEGVAVVAFALQLAETLALDLTISLDEFE